MPQKNYISHYEHLKDKWTDQEGSLQKKLWQRHEDALQWFVRQSQQVATSSAAGILLLSGIPTPQMTPPVQLTHQVQTATNTPLNATTFLIADLYNKLPRDLVPLTHEQEDRITSILSARFGFSVKAELEGKHLARSYGLIGQEQHLARYPGDNMSVHLDASDAQQYTTYGMAPGLSAWGYFAPSKNELTDGDTNREKWYIAVQTWLSPGYNDHVKEFNDFFKYRKMLVINPQNGKAVVADIADAGPAEWTGKQLGGSPEVMRYLERRDGSEKGPVLYFFVDDPENKIPLGPVKTK